MILEVQNGCFGYPKQPVILENINLSLEEGHILAILGPNGIGKTTLLKCMIGLLPWHSGKALFLWEGYPHPQAEGCLEHYLLHSAVPWLRFFLHRSGNGSAGAQCASRSLSATRQRGNRNGGSHDGTSGDHPSCQQGLQPDERR